MSIPNNQNVKRIQTAMTRFFHVEWSDGLMGWEKALGEVLNNLQSNPYLTRANPYCYLYFFNDIHEDFNFDPFWVGVDVIGYMDENMINDGPVLQDFSSGTCFSLESSIFLDEFNFQDLEKWYKDLRENIIETHKVKLALTWRLKINIADNRFCMEFFEDQ